MKVHLLAFLSIEDKEATRLRPYLHHYFICKHVRLLTYLVHVFGAVD